MAESPEIFVTNIEILANGLAPLFRVPTGFGKVTILDCTVTMQTAGTAGLYLVDAGTAGTATTGGTLASYAGTAYTAKTPKAMTVSATTPYITEGSYLAVKEDNTGTTVDITQVAITYQFGR